MKYIVSVSGGLGSAEALKRTIDTYGKENVIAVFADVKGDGSHYWMGMPTITRLLHERFGGESQDTYQFLFQLAHALDVPIHRIESSKTIYDVFYDTKSITPLAAVCKASEILKRKAIANWIREQGLGRGGYTMVLGMGWDEEHRVKSSAYWWRRELGYAITILAPNARLAFTAWQLSYGQRYTFVQQSYIEDQFKQYTYATNEQTALWLKELGVDIPEAYELGLGHNNCGKKCVLAGMTQWGHVYHIDYEGYMYAAFMELGLQKAIGKSYTILKYSRDGQTTRLSLYLFASKNTTEATLLNRPNIHTGDYPKLDTGACTCFTDIDLLRDYVNTAPMPVKQLELLKVAS